VSGPCHPARDQRTLIEADQAGKYVGENVRELRMGLEVVGGVVLGLVLAVFLIVRFGRKNR
jgi:hypothetical protein